MSPSVESRCPDCGSTHVVAAQLESTGENPGPVRVRPAGVPRRLLGASTVDPWHDGAVHACLTCGLLWGRVPRLELRALLAEHGTPEVRAWAAAVPTASRHGGGAGPVRPRRLT